MKKRGGGQEIIKDVLIYQIFDVFVIKRKLDMDWRKWSYWEKNQGCKKFK
jgi:hypothetical protein